MNSFEINQLKAIFDQDELAAIRRAAGRLGRPWVEGLGLAWLIKATPPGARPFEERLGSAWRNQERSTLQDGLDLRALALVEEQRRHGGGGLGDKADLAGLPEGGTQELAARLGVSRRRAQQILKQAVEHFHVGDLFTQGVGNG
ncbi:MAG: hypothetical protein ACOZAQ_06715 [Pseudomonadota bacterium]